MITIYVTYPSIALYKGPNYLWSKEECYRFTPSQLKKDKHTNKYYFENSSTNPIGYWFISNYGYLHYIDSKGNLKCKIYCEETNEMKVNDILDVETNNESDSEIESESESETDSDSE